MITKITSKNMRAMNADSPLLIEACPTLSRFRSVLSLAYYVRRNYQRKDGYQYKIQSRGEDATVMVTLIPPSGQSQ